jgi:hypothetical protein
MNKKYGIVNEKNFSYSMNSNEELSDEEKEISVNSAPSNSMVEYVYSQVEAINVLNANYQK